MIVRFTKHGGDDLMRNISKAALLGSLVKDGKKETVCPNFIREARCGKGIKRRPTIGEGFRLEQGKEVGGYARELYPDGLLIEEGDMRSSSKRTDAVMGDKGVSTIFEGAFLSGGFAARADILIRDGERWKMIEVKSRVIEKRGLIDDMAYTCMVIERCGVEISAVSLLLISKDFRLGKKAGDLFVENDRTDIVLSRIDTLRPLVRMIEEVSDSAVNPDPELKVKCRKCEFFRECFAEEIEDHIFDLPRLSKSKFDKLVEQGILSINDIPAEFPLTENQDRVKGCVQRKDVYIGGGLKDELDAISYPVTYLDFETVMTAIPLYPNTAPYEQVPIQYSIHRCSRPGELTLHREYLSNDPGRDCRRELAKNLIIDLKGTGSIVVYSDFEKNILKKLGVLFPDLSRDLNSLIDRLKDLEAVIKKNFYHPDFHGSTSIKSTLPAMVPTMTYSGLEICDGEAAMATFARLARGSFNNGEVEEKRKQLLEYCMQDTYAMVRLHEKLQEYDRSHR